MFKNGKGYNMFDIIPFAVYYIILKIESFLFDAFVVHYYIFKF